MGGREKPPLSKPEWACLQAIARCESALSSDRYAVATGVPHCTDAILERLRSLGLIEFATELWMPLEMKREVIRMTAAGKALLPATK